MLLVDVQCEVCENCGALAFETERVQSFTILVYFSHFISNSETRGRKERKKSEEGKG
jgi:hypothetical protein